MWVATNAISVDSPTDWRAAVVSQGRIIIATAYGLTREEAEANAAQIARDHGEAE